MKYAFSLFLMLFCLSTLLPAQSPPASNKGLIKGQLQDEQGTAVAYATISLFTMQQELLFGAISDDHGIFTLDEVPLDSVQLEVRFLGFQPFQQVLLLHKKQKKIDLGVIRLQADAQQLEEVTVRAEASEYQLRLDKKVFMVGKDILSQGGSAIDVLDQVPLVSVEPGGGVSLRGNSQVQILINGKRSGLTMNNALDQIDSDNIERIEVITNPSASFDASGSAGIINIILKKNKKEGLSGQVRTVLGAPANHMVLPGINYKNQKISLFTNLRWRYSDYNGRYLTRQSGLVDGRNQLLDQKEIEDRHDDGRSGYFGADFYFNPKNTVTLAFFRAETKDTDVTFLEYDFFEDGKATGMLRTDGNSVENRNYNQLEANYTRTFDKEGKKWTFDFQYDFWNSIKNWDLRSSGTLLPEGIGSQLRTVNTMGSRDYVWMTDLVQPLTKSSKLNMGAKFENRVVINDYVAEVFDADEWSIYQGISNEVKYTERIGAAYVQYQGALKKWEYSVGLRSEYTNIDIVDAERTFTEQKEYLNFFPSLSLSFPFSENMSIQGSYSRRINRPSLWNLYPFFEITDFNLQEVGNPNLNPSFSDVFELSLLKVSDKWTLSPAAYYRTTLDPFQRFLQTNEQGTFIIQPINLTQRETVGAEVSMRYEPHKAVRLNTEVHYFYFNESGEYLGQALNAKGTSWTWRISSNVNLPKGIKWQTQFNYWGAEQRVQTKQLANYVLNFGLSKNFLDDRLNIGFRGYNVLGSRASLTISEYENYTIERDNRRVRARYSVSFLYKINQRKGQRMRQQRRQNR